MKKLLICLCATLLLASCDIDDGMEYKDPNLVRHDNDYAEGFDDGYSAAQANEEWDKFEEYVDIINDVNEYATEYACKNSYWHPEEAVCVIEAYRDGGSVYTEKDYNNAVNSLVAFYEYFYNSMYDDFFELM